MGQFLAALAIVAISALPLGIETLNSGTFPGWEHDLALGGLIVGLIIFLIPTPRDLAAAGEGFQHLVRSPAGRFFGVAIVGLAVVTIAYLLSDKDSKLTFYLGIGVMVIIQAAGLWWVFGQFFRRDRG